MNIQRFNAVCPFEIGDVVIDGRTGRKRTITDIACIHYCRSGKVEFLYELDNFPNYVTIQTSAKKVSVSITFE